MISKIKANMFSFCFIRANSDPDITTTTTTTAILNYVKITMSTHLFSLFLLLAF
jgi:hypothetical protein